MISTKSVVHAISTIIYKDQCVFIIAVQRIFLYYSIILKCFY